MTSKQNFQHCVLFGVEGWASSEANGTIRVVLSVFCVRTVTLADLTGL